MAERGTLSLGRRSVDVEVDFNPDRKGGVFRPEPLMLNILEMLTNAGRPTLTVGDESFTIRHVVRQSASSGYVFERIE
jgi:hypothetical protein